MTATLVLKQGISFWLLVALLGGCCHAPAPTPAPAITELPPTEETGKIQQIIEAEVDGLTCHYLCQSFWAGDEFSSHLANQAQFKADFRRDFEHGLTRSDVAVSASDYSFSFDSATWSIVSRCDIHSAISKGDSRYLATFFWLLTPLGLDFINNNFAESKCGLSWEGTIQGIPTTVNVKLPATDNIVYKAWAEPIGHCHAHIWWCQ